MLFRSKHVNSLSPTEPTELSQMVPGMVQRTETVFTGAIHTGAERLHGIQTLNQPTHNDGSEDLSHRLTLRSDSGIQLPTDHRQPLLELPVAGSENFHLPYRCYNTVRTPTLCIPDMSDRHCYFLSTYLI